MGCGAHVHRRAKKTNTVLPFDPPSQSIPLQSTVAPENWALELEQLLTTIRKYMHTPCYEDLKKPKGYVNLYDLNEHFVKPETRGTGCGVALTLNSEEPKRAEVMISHAWGEDVEELEDALMRTKMSSRAPHTPVWFCFFSLYQCGDLAGDCGPTIKTQLDMQPFFKVIHLPGIEMVVVHTTKEEVYDRLWCVHEIDEALSTDIKVTGIASKLYAAKYVDRNGVYGRVQSEDIVVKTEDAKCSNQTDEAFIRALVMEKRSFAELDEVILAFRRRMLESFLPELKVRPLSPRASTLLEEVLSESLGDNSPRDDIVDNQVPDVTDLFKSPVRVPSRQPSIASVRVPSRQPSTASLRSSSSSSTHASQREARRRGSSFAEDRLQELKTSFSGILPQQPSQVRDQIRRHTDLGKIHSAITVALDGADFASEGLSSPITSFRRKSDDRRAVRSFSLCDRRLSQGALLVPLDPRNSGSSSRSPSRPRSRASSICSVGSQGSMSRSSHVRRISEERAEFMDSPPTSPNSQGPQSQGTVETIRHPSPFGPRNAEKVAYASDDCNSTSSRKFSLGSFDVVVNVASVKAVAQFGSERSCGQRPTLS